VSKQNKHLTLAAAIFLLALNSSAQTIAGGAPSVPIPAVGISALEMVQVNVTNMAPFSPAGGLEPNCTGVILFYSSPAYSPGSVLPFAQKTFSITSGQTFSFSTNYSATGGNGTGRSSGRRSISPPPSEPRPPASW